MDLKRKGAIIRFKNLIFSKMENKKSIKNLKLLLIICAIFIIIGVIIKNSNINNINDLNTVETTANQELKDEKDIIKTEEILATYATKRENANEEIISRYNRARERESYISIDEIKISKDMDLTVRCNVSREDFIELITNVKADTSGFFEENAGIIYDLCKEYQINEIFFCGLISAESGWDIAGNHRRTHNYISLMGNGGYLIQFDTVEEGLEKAAIALHNNYLTPGGKFYSGKTLEAVRKRFCPVNPNWTNLVYGRMQQII